MVVIYFYSGFRERMGRESIEIDVDEVLRFGDLLLLTPEVRRVLEEFDSRGVPYAIVVDGVNILLGEGLDHIVRPDSKIKMFTYVSGGFQEIYSAYKVYKEDIDRRIREFSHVIECGGDRILLELLFCLCTPQNKALRCWDFVKKLYLTGVYRKGDPASIRRLASGIRFKNRKSRYMADAIKLFNEGGLDWILDREYGDVEAREALVMGVRGIGYKEASHFLRNIGYSFELAILDRHILRWMARYRLVNRPIKTLTRRRYYMLEMRFRWFARMLRLSPAELDLLLWALETGYVFK